MQTKSVLYAAVGAPVVAARKMGIKVNELRAKLSEDAKGYGQAAEKALGQWAVEGEKVVGRISDGKVADEITAKVDLDQAKVQVGKLRDQLEDMLATWRASFRPEAAGEAKGPAPKSPAANATAKRPPAKKPAAKASAAKTTKSTAAKTTTNKTEPAQTDKAS